MFAAEPLQYIFHLPDAIAGSTMGQKQRFTCQRPVTPLVDMSNYVPFYKPSTTQSVVDPKAMAVFSKRTWPVTATKAKLLESVNAAIAEPRDRKNAANCILLHLRAWADRNALLGNLDDNNPLGRRQAVMVGGWATVGFANAYAVSLDASPTRSDANRSIEAWFKTLSDEMLAEFTPPSEPRPRKYRWLDDNSNLRYWAAASVGLVAVHLQDRAKFDWAMNVLHMALDVAPEDGGLPRELARGGKALHYQLFATQALSLLVALADANHVQLTTHQESRLQAIVRFSARGYAMPSLIEERTGYKQDETKREMISWIDMVIGRLRDRNRALATELDAVAAPLRPMTDGFVALPTTNVFRR